MQSKWLSTNLIVLAAVVLPAAGCTMPAGDQPDDDNGSANETRMNVPLFMMTEQIELAAGETNSFSEVFTYPDTFGPFESLTVNIADTLGMVTVAPGDAAKTKGEPVLTSTATAEVYYYIGPAADIDTVCQTGDGYGPFVISFDESAQPTGSDPETLALRETSMQTINGRSFAVCVEIVPPIDLILFAGNVAVDMTEPPAFDLTGTWDYSRQITVANGVCRGDEQQLPERRIIRIEQKGNAVSLSGFGEDLGGGLDGATGGNMIEFSGLYLRLGSAGRVRGTANNQVSSRHTGTVMSNDMMSGTESWAWVGSDGRCADGEAEWTATRRE